MKIRIKRLVGYTLLELLVVITLFIILGAIGIGGYLGTRETMIARETVETIKQDIRSARLKAMLLKKEEESNWIYGIGIDFGSLSSVGGSGPFFKWCSPFEDFGNEVTKSPILGSYPNEDIGEIIQVADVLGVSTGEDLYAAITDLDGLDCRYTGCSTGYYCTYNSTSKTYSCVKSTSSDCRTTHCPTGYYCTYNSTSKTYSCVKSTSSDCRTTHCPTGYYCTYNSTSKTYSCVKSTSSDCRTTACPTGYSCNYNATYKGYICEPNTSPQPPQPSFENGKLPSINIPASSCIDQQSSMVFLNDLPSGNLSSFENISVNGGRYLVFEAVTGRAFLYTADGSPINYETDGDFIEENVLDIVIKRDYSSKFDVVTVYPLSGTVIHHVYTELDQKCGASDPNCIEVNGVKYVRYGIADEINSYRE